MESITVYVVTDTEGGWDNVQGVYTSIKKAFAATFYEEDEFKEDSTDKEIEKIFRNSRYVLHERVLD